MLTLTPTYCSSSPLKPLKKFQIRVSADGFPSFLPQQTDNIKDSFARNLARRIERLPVQLTSSGTSIMSSCVRPMVQEMFDPIVLLHGFDSSCLEWRYTYPLLEDAGLESWAFDILGWGFSDLERLPQCDVASKRNHLYQFWKSYIKRPMILVGPSLGAAVAIDFAVNHPEAVSKLILIDASVYSEGTGEMANLPRLVAYAGVALLKSVPLRLYVNRIAFNDVSFSTSLDWMNIGRLHCLYPWWEDATVSFMSSGGYNAVPLIKQVKQQTLIIWGEDDQIISYKLAVVSFSETCIMSSCIRPTLQGKTNPIVLLRGFDSSCLEWRSMYPLLEEAGAESWAIDILGWGFSNLERLPSCDVASKRDHMYQFWKFYIKRPMILVGPSLGAVIAIDFAVNHPEAVSKLVLIDASVYAEGIGGMAQLPCIIAKTGFLE